MLEISKRKAEKRVVETEQPSRNWSGSRTLLDRFHGAEPLSVSPFLSVRERIAEVSKGQMDVWRGPRSSARVVREDSN